MFSREYCEIFKSIYFEKHLRMAASAACCIYWLKPNLGGVFRGSFLGEEVVNYPRPV